MWLLLSPDEREVLRGLPHEQQLMYHAIKLKMDGETGIAGRSARISQQYLREALEVRPERGRRADRLFELSKDVGRRLIDGLERVGLVKRLRGPADAFVFLLPIAAQGLSAPGIKARFQHLFSAPCQTPEESNNGAGLQGVGGVVTTPDDHGIKAPPQSSVKSLYVGELEGECESARVAPGEAGALCRVLRGLGVSKLNSSHPELLRALGMGIKADAWVAAVKHRVDQGHDPPALPWLAAAVIGRHLDGLKRAQGNGASRAGRGQSESERAEAAMHAGHDRARERIGRLTLVPGGRAG